MTTSCVYHTQGIRGYKYQKTERTKDTEVYSSIKYSKTSHSSQQLIEARTVRAESTLLPLRPLAQRVFN